MRTTTLFLVLYLGVYVNAATLPVSYGPGSGDATATPQLTGEIASNFWSLDFYGEAVTQIHLGYNGQITFDGQYTTSNSPNANYNYAQIDKPLFTSFWSLLDSTQGGNVYYTFAASQPRLVELETLTGLIGIVKATIITYENVPSQAGDCCATFQQAIFTHIDGPTYAFVAYEKIDWTFYGGYYPVAGVFKGDGSTYYLFEHGNQVSTFDQRLTESNIGVSGSWLYDVSTVSITAGASGDPHFNGFDGIRFDFNGESGSAYNILSTSTVSLDSVFTHFENTFLDEYSTWFSKMVLRTAEGDLVLDPSANQVSWEGNPLELSEIVSNNGITIAVESLDLIRVKTPDFVFEFSLFPEGDRAWCSDVCPHLDFTLTPTPEFMASEDAATVSGILGQTLLPVARRQPNESFLIPEGL